MGQTTKRQEPREARDGGEAVTQPITSLTCEHHAIPHQTGDRFGNSSFLNRAIRGTYYDTLRLPHVQIRFLLMLLPRGSRLLYCIQVVLGIR